MSNQLEKLKKSIKKEYTQSFGLDLIKTSGFIPVDKRQSDFFVILNKTAAANKDKIEELKKKREDLINFRVDKNKGHLLRERLSKTQK